MANSKSTTDMASALGEVGSALFELRDALVELSLSLKDWQFETDLKQRRHTETTVRQLLQKMTSARGSSS
jgi:hypothetical protein